MSPPSHVIDNLYEAAFTPERWDEALRGIGALADGQAGGRSAGCVILYSGLQPVGFKAIDEIVDAMGVFVAADAWQDSLLIRHFQTRPLSGYVDAADYYPPEVLMREPAIGMLAERGFRSMLGTIIPMPGGELVVQTVNRKASEGPYDVGATERLNALHPHLARAAFIAARLGLERARSVAATLEALGLPAAVLSAGGRVTAVNALVDTVADTILATSFGGLALSHPPANRLLQAALRRTPAEAVSIPVPVRDGAAAMVVHVMPLRGSAQDIFSGAVTILVATRLNASTAVPAPSLLMGLFDLTPAEARLAAALSGSRSLKAAAQECRITFSTARSYLERIFAKTGTHQQTQLVALLKDVTPPR